MRLKFELHMQLSLAEIHYNVNEIFKLYEKSGNEEYGESVTQLIHMMQAANYVRAKGAAMLSQKDI